MNAPENKGNIEVQAAKPAQLPKVDQAAIIAADGSVQLPARPPEVDSKALSSKEGTHEVHESKHGKFQHQQEHIKEEILKQRIEDIGLLVARSEQERKALLTSVFAGQNPDKEVISFADNLIQLRGDASLIEQAMSGSLDQEALAKHLLGYIQQQRGFDCSARELAMLDSLEFQLMRVLQHVNPNIRIQQQQVQEDNAPDDDAGGGGPEKVEDERESSLEGMESELETETSTSYSPRSKKGKARSRSRDRKSRFRRWLARMMRVFRRQALFIRSPAATKPSAKTEVKDERFIKTVRIIGKVIDARTRVGVAGVQVISNNLGSALTAKDGTFAFDNITLGVSYSIAPFKSGYSFNPLSVNDVALDDREYLFEMEHD